MYIHIRHMGVDKKIRLLVLVLQPQPQLGGNAEIFAPRNHFFELRLV